MKQITSHQIHPQNISSHSFGARSDTDPSSPTGDILTLIAWLLLSSLLIIPLFLSSTVFIGRDGFHGIQVGIDNQAIIHGYQLTCTEATQMRDC